jgi:hypothetical protein
MRLRRGGSRRAAGLSILVPRRGRRGRPAVCNWRAVLLPERAAADSFGHEQNLADTGEDRAQCLRGDLLDAFGCLQDTHSRSLLGAVR